MNEKLVRSLEILPNIQIEGVKKYNIYGMYILWDLDFF